MNNLIISAVGPDRPGIVSELSGIITSHGGNVAESRMTRLGSDFTIIMIVKVDSKWEEALIVSLQAIKDLSFITKATASNTVITDENYQITLRGADNEGIVKVLSKYLVGKSINILEMETNISNAPITGTPLFNLIAITTISDNTDFKEIQSDLTLIGKKLGVEITVTQSEYTVEMA